MGKVSKIKNANKAKIRLTDNQEVIKSFLRVKSFFRNGEWLSKNNRYSKNTIARIKRDTPGTNNIKAIHMRDYISVSSLLHCLDGWVYLGKAVNSILNLNFDVARHLIYYSELRAGISILSSQGIGIFHNKHVVLKSGKQTEYISNDLTTHDMTWEALKYWNSLRKSSYLLLEIIRPGGKSLNDWLSEFGIDTYREEVGTGWLKSWGIDLKRFSYDQEARNYLSYRPTLLSPRNIFNFDEIIHLIDDLWESSDVPTFQKIDIQLLKLSLIRSFELKTGKNISNAKDEFDSRIDLLIDNIAPTGFSNDFWKETLKKQDNESILVKQAFGKDLVSSPSHYIQMFSRAFFIITALHWFYYRESIKGWYFTE